MIYQKKPELIEYVRKLKETYPENLGHIEEDKIMYLSFSKKKSQALAYVGPVPKRYSFYLSDMVYFIEVYEENWAVSDEAKKFYIVFHELLHIPAGGFIPDGKSYRKTVKHDIQDFQQLLAAYGVCGEKLDLLEKQVKGEKKDAKEETVRVQNKV